MTTRGAPACATPPPPVATEQDLFSSTNGFEFEGYKQQRGGPPRWGVGKQVI